MYTKKFKTEQDFVNQYLKEIRDYPQLTKPEERVFLKEYRATKSKAAMNKLITSNLRFVVSVSIKYQNQGLAMPELINEGNLGLMEAVNRFDIAQDIKFISYAVWWIRQSIIKALYEKSRLVRVSAEKESKSKKVNRFAEMSLQEFGYINYDYIAGKVESSTYDVQQILSLNSNRVSFDNPIGDDDGSKIYDLIEDTTVVKPDEFLGDRSKRDYIDGLLSSLNPQEQSVVRFYFGIGYDTSFNLEQIGFKMSISKERVRQVKKRALEKMKDGNLDYDLAICA